MLRKKSLALLGFSIIFALMLNVGYIPAAASNDPIANVRSMFFMPNAADPVVEIVEINFNTTYPLNYELIDAGNTYTFSAAKSAGTTSYAGVAIPYNGYKDIQFRCATTNSNFITIRLYSNANGKWEVISDTPVSTPTVTPTPVPTVSHIASVRSMFFMPNAADPVVEIVEINFNTTYPLNYELIDAGNTYTFSAAKSAGTTSYAGVAIPYNGYKDIQFRCATTNSNFITIRLYSNADKSWEVLP